MDSRIKKFTPHCVCRLPGYRTLSYATLYSQAETGNLGLKFMPYGGLYIAGGIITKVRYMPNPIFKKGVCWQIGNGE